MGLRLETRKSTMTSVCLCLPLLPSLFSPKISSHDCDDTHTLGSG